MISDLLASGTWRRVNGRFDFGGMSVGQVVSILQEEVELLASMSGQLCTAVTRRAQRQKAIGNLTPLCSDHIDDSDCVISGRPEPDRNDVMDSVFSPLLLFRRF